MTTSKTPAAPEAMVDVRANTITITDHHHKAWPAALHLVRQGWQIHLDYLPVEFKSTGHSTIMLTRSKYDEQFSALAVQIAAEAEQLASTQHMLAYKRDTQLAAEKIVADAQKAAAAAEMQAKVAAAEAALNAMKAAAAAA